MESLLNLDTREQKLTFDLMEALTSSLDLSEVLSRAYEVLSKLLAADYAAICISKPGRLADYDWMVAAMPPEYFARYHEMAPEDFVREAVMQHPNLVLRDSEMLPREELERSLLYRRCRELGMPLEHVMAVLLDVGRDWHGGFMLYRDRRQPFSDRERALMQHITPWLTNTVSKCREVGEIKGQKRALEHLVQNEGLESVVLTPQATEWMRTPGATALLEAWFKPEDRGPHGLPSAVLERFRVLASGRRVAGAEQDTTMEFDGMEKKLRVSFVPLPEPGSGRLWGLVLKEETDRKPLPQAWCALLTPREAQVAECALRGWDNQTIAEHLNCSVGTVKKHLQRVFDKMGVDTRTALMNRAARL
jgi:DNA-binding CsgD family transcriptional regulator